uniref:Uncharacterized protein n=1 Tax=Sipha flava TaxID=143950 RepID=A0A2S2R9L4_9HEMI
MPAVARVAVVLWLLCAAAAQCTGIGIRHGRSRNARNLRPNGQSPAKLTSAGDGGGGGGVGGGGLDNDIVNRLLRIVESQQQLGNNCTAGTHLNLGEGVVDRYAQVHLKCLLLYLLSITSSRVGKN